MPRACALHQVWEEQADVVLNQANPVSGNPYAVLATTRNVRILGVMAYVTWTVQPTPLQVHITVDGITKTYEVANPVSTTYYKARNEAGNAPANQVLDTTAWESYRPFLLEGRSVSVTAETTGGTVQVLYCRIKYAIIP